MKIKFLKHLAIVPFIFLLALSKVSAVEYSLRYDVTDLNMNPDKGTLSFGGWAFVHHTHNFAGSGIGSNNTPVYDRYGNQITDGGQRVKIQAYNKTTGQVIEEKEFRSTKSNNEVKYNFYCQMFFKYLGAGYSCIESNYNNTSINYGVSLGNGNYGGNRCDANYSLQACYYEDMYFKISFNTVSWQDSGKVSDGDKIEFRISAGNEDYYRKTGNYYTPAEQLFIKKSVVKNYGNDKSKLQIDTTSVSDVLYFFADQAILRDYTNTTYPAFGDNYAYGCHDEYDIAKVDIGSFKEGYQKVQNNVDFLRNSYTPGMYLIRISSSKSVTSTASDGSSFYCYPSGRDTYQAAWGSWVKPTGAISFTVITHNEKKCDPVVPSSGALSCNNGKNYTSTCNELTVSKTENGNTASAVVKINQTGTISNVLNPTTLYQGGGFNLGIVYSNSISWSYVGNVRCYDTNGNACSNGASLIEKAMKEKIKDINVFTAGINLTNIKFNGKSIDSNFMYKKCTESGKFTNNSTLTTTCTFFLPESKLDTYNGNVKYVSGSLGVGINNKYYTPTKYSGKYAINMSINGMSRITDTAAVKDSKIKGKPWTGTWNDTFTGCSITITSLYYNTDKKTSFKFIYRPIDLTNPFPNRNPGVNWFEWYSKQQNKERLEQSYKNLEYSIPLDNQKINEIKKYNKAQNGKDGYFDWDTMNGDESTFLKKYFGGGKR